MPAPSTSIATLRPDLGGSMLEFDLAMNRARMIASMVFPILDVAKPSGTFGKVTRASLLKAMDTKRAPGSPYNRSKFEFQDDSYLCLEHGAEMPIDDREAKMYAEYFDAELMSAERARHMVLSNYEKRIADTVFDAVTYSPTAVLTQWSDKTNSTPLTDVEAAIQRGYAKGIILNTLVISWPVFRNLRLNDQIADKIASSGAGSSVEPARITAAKLAEVFDVDKVLVGGMLQNTADDGQTGAYSGLWSDEYAAVIRTPTTNDIQEPCFGRTLHYSEDGSTIGTTMETYRDETVRGDVVRSRFDTDEKVMFSDAIELLSNITVGAS